MIKLSGTVVVVHGKEKEAININKIIEGTSSKKTACQRLTHFLEDEFPEATEFNIDPRKIKAKRIPNGRRHYNNNGSRRKR